MLGLFSAAVAISRMLIIASFTLGSIVVFSLVRLFQVAIEALRDDDKKDDDRGQGSENR